MSLIQAAWNSVSECFACWKPVYPPLANAATEDSDTGGADGSAQNQTKGHLPANAVLGTFLSFAGLVLLLPGNFWCDYATHNVSIYTPSVLSGAVEYQLHSGLWNYRAYDAYVNTEQFGTIEVNQYSYCVPYSNVEIDSQWRSARIFAIIAAVFGGITFFGSFFALCIDPHPFQGKACAGLAMITVIFEGLTFLYIPSNGCEGGQRESTGGDGNLYVENWSNCTISTAAKLNIASMCSFFVAAIFMWCYALGARYAEAEAHAESLEKEKKLEKKWIPTFMQK